MALPSLTKTWQYNVNNAQTAQGTVLADMKLAMLNIKTALIGFGTNPWTVVSSSNSVTANSSDNWTTTANLVWAAAGVIHSWIVLKQTGIGSNAQLLIDLANVSSVNAIIKFSPSTGFTGGTTTNAPTAADSFTVNSTSWCTFAADAALRWSVSQSTDGQCTRWFIFVGGTLASYCMIEKGANATGGTPGATNSGWTQYSIGASGLNNLAGNTVQNAVNAATVISYEASSNLTIASEIDGVWDIFPIGQVCTATVGARGRLFTLQDVWVSSSGIATGDTFPATGSPAAQFIVIAAGANFSVVLPWNNGAFNLT